MLIKPLQHLDHVYKVIFNCEENENYFLYPLLTDTAHVTWILCSYCLYSQPWVNIMEGQAAI